MKKKLYINGRIFSQRVTGIQRYGIEALHAIDRQLAKGEHPFLDNYDIEMLLPFNARPVQLEYIRCRIVGRLKGNLWEQIELPYFSKDGVLLSFASTGPIVKKNQIITIHDASVFAVPQAYSFKFRAWYKTLLTYLGARILAVITVSNFSKKEINHYYKIPLNKLFVVKEGWQHIQSIAADTDILNKLSLTKPFVLAVSSLTPNKNFSAVIQAMELLKNPDFDFVIAGGSAKVFAGSKLENAPFLKLAGYVSDAELRCLYESAACFVYPSLYEGFGIPPIEAMACGCPVIASNASCLPEVCQDAVLYCDPKNPADIASKLTTLIHSDSMRSELKDKGLKHSAMFSWDDCARSNMVLLKKVLQ